MENKTENLKHHKKHILLPYKKCYNFNLKKYTITSYKDNEFSSYKKNILTNKNNGLIKNPISDLYYKNPFFYNDNNLDLQIKVLKELEKLDVSQNSSCTPSNTNNNTKHSSATSLDKKFNFNINNFNNTEKILSRNKMSNYTDTNSNLNLPTISNNYSKDNKNIKIEINNKYFNDEEDESKKTTIKNYISLDHNSRTEKKDNNYLTYRSVPKKLKENDDYFYKIVFRSKPLFKSEQKMIIDNKFNMIYAENETQYKNIIEKHYNKLFSEGKKIKSKNVAPSIKLKLNEAKNRIQFMKGIMDYSYPGFVLSKIKNMQKKLNEHKKQAKYLNCLNGMEIRNKEQKERNQFRKEYLLKSITLLK